MAATIHVYRVSAVPVIPIANRDDTVTLTPNNELHELWHFKNPNTETSDKLASKSPLGLKLGQKYVIQIEGEINFPTAWHETDEPAPTCILKGYLVRDNKSLEVLRATWKEPTLGLPAPDRALAHVDYAHNAELIWPVAKDGMHSMLPFGFRGNIRWSLEAEHKPG